jgi:hypothetical protein
LLLSIIQFNVTLLDEHVKLLPRTLLTVIIKTSALTAACLDLPPKLNSIKLGDHTPAQLKKLISERIKAKS